MRVHRAKACSAVVSTFSFDGGRAICRHLRSVGTKSAGESSCHPRQSKRLGSAIVETAFMLPIMLSITFGVVEFGRALMVSNLITNAAREGTRLGIVRGVTTAEVKAAVVDQVLRTVGTTIQTSAVDVVVTPYQGNPNPNNETANAMTRDLVHVQVNVAYNDVGYFFRYLAGITLRGQCAMRHE